MRADELNGLLPFFLHELRFADLLVAANFFVLRDASSGVGRVEVIDVIVAKPKFERKIGTERDESVEDEIVAEGPGSATEENEEQRENRTRTAQGDLATRANPGPA